MRGCLKGGCLNAKMLNADGPEPLTQEGLQVCDVASMGILVINECNPLRFFATEQKSRRWNSCFNDATQEILVSVVICLNFVVIIIEANYGAECDGNMTSHASMLIPPNLAPVFRLVDTWPCYLVPGKWMLPNAGRCQVAVYQGGYLLSTIVLWHSTLWKLL